MKVLVLGSGAAGGVPMISAGWGKCDPANPKNRRSRPSILVEEAGLRILVDTSPDLREQLLGAGVRALDAVLYTHCHADHLHGIDDLREINRAMGRPIDLYASQDSLDEIARRFGYVLTPIEPEARVIYKPLLIPHPIAGPFDVGPLEIVPILQDHGTGPTLGFRFGDFAYSTDLTRLPEDSFALLEGLDTWLVGCLTDHPHETHADVEKVIGWVERLKPRRTVLTHMGPALDFDILAARLPPGMEPAYDGMTLSI